MSSAAKPFNHFLSYRHRCPASDLAANAADDLAADHDPPAAGFVLRRDAPRAIGLDSRVGRP